jgi:hypothetical protein
MDIVNNLKDAHGAVVGASVEYEGGDKLALMIVNSIAFVICMIANGTS